MMKTLGIDIGGSYIKVGIQSEYKLIHNVQIPNTATNTEEFEQLLSTNLLDLISQFEIQAIGVGFPGSVDSKGHIISAPNLPFLINLNILDLFKNQTNKPVFVQNDAYFAGFAESKINELGEYYFITLGTGIGSVLIRNNNINTTLNGSSGELGHIIINKLEIGDNYRTGIFEKYFNANVFVEKAKNDLKNFPNSMLHSLNEFSVREISDAVNIGDDLAIVNFMEMGKILGLGLSSAANLTGIPIFVIGGGISQVNNLLFDTATTEMKKRVIPELKDKVQIIKSNLYNEAGMLGAAIYAMEKTI